MVKRIIAAVASTNAVIAAMCAIEVFKVATSCANPLNNYLIFNDADGIYTYAYEASKNENCMACSRKIQVQLDMFETISRDSFATFSLSLTNSL